MSESKGITTNWVLLTTACAVITAVVTLGVTAIWNYSLSPEAGIVDWLKSDFKLSHWVLLLWVLWSAFTTAFFFIQKFFVPNAVTVTTAPVSKRRIIPYAAYTSDVFFGLRWRWSMTSIGQFFNMRMFCLNCDYELGYDDFDSGYGRQGGYCRCGHCAEIVKFATESVVDLTESAQKLAEKKIRSGEWEKAVESELRATKDRALRQQSP